MQIGIDKVRGLSRQYPQQTLYKQPGNNLRNVENVKCERGDCPPGSMSTVCYFSTVYSSAIEYLSTSVADLLYQLVNHIIIFAIVVVDQGEKFNCVISFPPSK